MKAFTRSVLWLAAFSNLLGAIAFLPKIGVLRTLFNLPYDAHAFYFVLMAAWIALFGVAYFYMALRKVKNRGLMLVGAAMKFIFAAAIIYYVLKGAFLNVALIPAIADSLIALALGYSALKVKHINLS